MTQDEAKAFLGSIRRGELTQRQGFITNTLEQYTAVPGGQLCKKQGVESSANAEAPFSYNVEVISPEMARAVLDYSRSAGFTNRTESKEMIAKYAREMKNGAWVEGVSHISFDKTGCLIDGYHRMMAVVMAGVPISFLVVRGLERDSFSVFDVGKMRSVADMLYIDGYKQNIRALAADIRLMLSYLKTGRFELLDFCDPLLAYDNIKKTAGYFYEELKEGYRNYGMLKACKIIPSLFDVLWVIFGFINSSNRDKFFEYIRTGADLSVGHPVHTLREKIIGYRNTVVARRSYLAVEAMWVITGWNYFCKGAQLSRLIGKRGSTPPILGFDKKAFLKEMPEIKIM